jgi:UDP-galactopyranose mutase
MVTSRSAIGHFSEAVLKLIYTGPIDEYYSYRFGRLPHRSVRFEHEHLSMSQFQPVGTVNYPNDVGASLKAAEILLGGEGG